MAPSKGSLSTNALAKDKKVVSSSNYHPTTNTKRKTISTKPRSDTSSSIDSAASTPSEKQVPNYLKPTRASQMEPPILKKTGLLDAPATSKVIENRRRSFDRPPSATRLQNAFVSPGPRERILTVRASSSPSSKLIVEKTSKTARDGKTRALSSKTKSDVKGSTPTLDRKTRSVGSIVAKSAEHLTQTSDSETKPELDHQEPSSEKSMQVEGDHSEVEVPPQGLEFDKNSCSTVSEHEQHDDVVDSDQSKNGGGEVERVIPTVSEEPKQSLSVVIEDQVDYIPKPEAHTVEREDAGGVELSNGDLPEKHSPNASDEIEVGIIEEGGEESNVLRVVENVMKTLDDTEGTGSENDTWNTQKEGRGDIEGGAEEKTKTTATKSEEGSERGVNRMQDMIEETVIHYKPESASN